MTVIIRGLDKPKECLGCQFCLKDHGRDYCIFDGEYINWEDGTINLDCPLEEYEASAEAIPVSWIEECIRKAKRSGSPLIAQLWQGLIDRYRREKK